MTVNQAMDFSMKNRISLADLHHIFSRAVFPESMPPQKRFGLTEDEYRFLWKYLSQQPVVRRDSD